LARNNTAISSDGRTRSDQLRAPAGHRIGLRHLVGEHTQIGLGSRGSLPDQVQPQPRLRASRLADDRVGKADDLRRGPIVANEPHHDGAAVTAGEVDEIGRRGPGERIDRLGRVTDDRQVLPPAQPRFEEPLLQRVHVLVLVDNEMPILSADLFGDVGVLLDAPAHGAQQVFEVDDAGGALCHFVGGEHRLHLRRVQRQLAIGLGGRDGELMWLDQ
jgi:hypothetical protein